MNPSRFTLIDLGAVVTLSAIGLGAIVQPGIPKEYEQDFQAGRQVGGKSIAAMRDRAVSSICMANLKQLGMAMQMYATDNKSNYPGANPKGWVKDGPGWDEALGNHLGVTLDPKEMVGDKEYPKTHLSAQKLKVFTCPGDPNGQASPAIVRSYSLNLGSAKDFAPNETAIPIARIQQPGRTVVLTEYHLQGSKFGVRTGNYTISQGEGATASFTNFKQWAGQTGAHAAPARQGQRPLVNLLFGDGHVEAVSPQIGDQAATMLFSYKKVQPKAPIIAPPMDE